MIELIIVMTIIGVITVVVLPRTRTFVIDTRELGAEQEMGEIVRAIMGEPDTGYEGFATHMGRYPTDAEGIAILHTNGGLPAFNPILGTGWGGPYVDSEDRDNNSVPDIEEDGWGNAYDYDEGAQTLTSYGRDGAAGGTGADADIVYYFE